MTLIEYPGKRSEVEIQSLLWYFLRKRKIDARLQITGYDTAKAKKCKLDMVIFVDKEPRCIIECRSWSAGYAATASYRTNNTKQIRKYEELYGLPVIVCGRMSYITKTIVKIEEVLGMIPARK